MYREIKNWWSLSKEDLAKILYERCSVVLYKMHQECIRTNVHDTFVCYRFYRMELGLFWKWCRHFSDVFTLLCERFQLKKFAFVLYIYWIKRTKETCFLSFTQRTKEPLWMFVLKNQLMIQWPFSSFQLNFPTKNEWIFSDVFPFNDFFMI